MEWSRFLCSFHRFLLNLQCKTDILYIQVETLHQGVRSRTPDRAYHRFVRGMEPYATTHRPDPHQNPTDRSFEGSVATGSAAEAKQKMAQRRARRVPAAPKQRFDSFQMLLFENRFQTYLEVNRHLRSVQRAF